MLPEAVCTDLHGKHGFGTGHKRSDVIVQKRPEFTCRQRSTKTIVPRRQPIVQSNTPVVGDLLGRALGREVGRRLEPCVAKSSVALVLHELL